MSGSRKPPPPLRTAVLLLLVSTVCRLFALELTVDSWNSRRVSLTYRLTPDDLSTRSDTFSLPIGVPCFPESKPIAHAYPQVPGHTTSARVLDGGWMGARYIRWVDLTICIPADKDPADLSGGIDLRFEQPVFAQTTSRVSIDNGIVDLPLRAGSAKRAAARKPAVPWKQGVRIEITGNGIYALSGRELRELGVPIGSIPRSRYRLFRKAVEIPVLITNEDHTLLKDGDQILFYGEELRGKHHYYTQYSSSSVYWLTWDTRQAGARIAQVSGSKRRNDKLYVDIREAGPSLKASNFRDTIHLESDADIRWLGEIAEAEQMSDEPTSDTIDNWYWTTLNGGQLTELEVVIPSPALSVHRSDQAHVRMAFMGLTSDIDAPDHRMNIYLNSKPLPTSSDGTRNDIRWDGQNPFEFTSGPVELSVLKHGPNTFTFDIPARDYFDGIAVNWIEVEYTRGFKAYGNRLRFRSSPRDTGSIRQFTLTGFSEPDLELWDLTGYRRFGGFVVDSMAHSEAQESDTGTTKYRLVFQDSIVTPSRYLAQSVNKRLSPRLMTLDTIRDDWDFPGGIDYVMITTKRLRETLEPLAELHRARGMQVSVIAIEDIFNRFSYGIQDPESIRTMLRYLFSRHSDSPPRYLLLAGDASHDLYKQRREQTIVPTYLSRVPGWGPAANDGYFASVQGEDNYPDLYVGRMPAMDAEQLELMVEKTIDYIEHPDRGYWRDNLLLAGGYEQDFTVHNDEVVTNIIGPRMNIHRMDGDVHSPWYHSSAIAARTMAGYINAGVYAINFAGHGGGNVWSDSKFFSYSDLSKLHNSQWGTSGRLPVVFSFTCLAGFFESVFYRSLGEEFLRNSRNGAIAFYGGAGYSLRPADIKMSQILLRAAVSHRFESLGALVAHTEAMMLAIYQRRAIPHIRQYNLLGDPALPWGLAPDSLKLHLSRNTLRGADTLDISGTTHPVNSGKVKIRIIADETPWHDETIPVENGTFSCRVALKEKAQTASGLVRAYAWNDSTQVRGWTRFSKDTILVTDVAISPSLPGPGDSVTISCRIVLPESNSTLPRVRCVHAIDQRQAARPDFEKNPGIILRPDTGGGSLIYRGAVRAGSPTLPLPLDPHLLLQFRVLEEVGASKVFAFPMQGKPDLTFSGDSLLCDWDGDSLSIVTQVRNQGSARADSVAVLLLWDGTGDTLAQTIATKALPPGSAMELAIALPDTQGLLHFSAHINSGSEGLESNLDNNSIPGLLSVSFADIQTANDTLHSPGKGVYVTPRGELARKHRAFLFSTPLTSRQPLSSPSQWLPVQGDGLQKFRIALRGSPELEQSLVWHFEKRQESMAKASGAEVSSVPHIFAFDSLNALWTSVGAENKPAEGILKYTSAAAGPFALGTSNDTTGPMIRAFVGGREILFLDYAAKGKPFSITFADPSGIDPASITVSLNGEPLESRYRSVVSFTDLSTATITAYPPPMEKIDTLSITVSDLAGNAASRDFAFMPGEKLKIRFFSCHPNPFTARRHASGDIKLVRFAFLLTDVATDVALNVYTMAGRKIWSWRNTTDVIGYQEIAWDGRTSSGFRIGNGTYYAKLEARNDGRSVRKTIRIAKLEGY